MSQKKTEVQNNPAGRLHQILGAARQQKGNGSARNAWAEVFEIDPADTGTLLRMLSDLVGLVQETESAIVRVDGVSHELHLKPFKRIRNLLSQVHLDNVWEHWKNQIDEPMLIGLQFSADTLSRVSGSVAISTDELNEIRAQIDTLFNQVTDSDLDGSLKLALLHNLSALKLSIATFKIHGIEGIEQEIGRSIGSVILRKEQLETADSKDKQSWAAFLALVDRLNKVATLARNTKALAAPILLRLSQFLGS